MEPDVLVSRVGQAYFSPVRLDGKVPSTLLNIAAALGGISGVIYRKIYDLLDFSVFDIFEFV